MTRREAPALIGGGLAIGVLLVAATLTVRQATGHWGQRFVGGDYRGYMDGARRFLETGSPFTPEQLSGSWTAMPDSFIHPPSALPLFLTFLPLPWLLWWAVPIGLIAYVLIRLRPAPWTWPLMALALCWPRSYTLILAGNTDLWVMAALAAGCRWGWPAVLAGIKPTLFPLALLFSRRRAWWIAGVGLAILTVPFLYLWAQWLGVVSSSPYGPWYSVFSLPLMLIPILAWLGRARPRVSAPETAAEAADRGEWPQARPPAFSGHDGATEAVVLEA